MMEEITCREQVFDVDFHPHGDFLATGLVDGSIVVYSYTDPSNPSIVLENNIHRKACRGVLFTKDGNRLYSISSDKSIQCIDSSGNQIFRVKKAHEDCINRVQSVSDDDTVIATGDDSGMVKIWDTRSNVQQVLSWKTHTDFISGMSYSSEKSVLVSVSGDATLASYDLRNPSNTTQSDDQESEIQCVGIIKNGRKIVCGCQEGPMLFFSWGKWGDCTDRFTGHKDSVNCLLPISDKFMLTGSSDGVIRLLSCFPHKIETVVAEHDDMPVEGIKQSRDGKVIASISHDDVIRLWDFERFLVEIENAEGSAVDGSEDDSDDADMEDEDNDESDGDCPVNENNDSSSDDSDEESDDSDDENKRGNSKVNSIFQTKNQRFFADL